MHEQQDAADFLGAKLFWGDLRDGSVPPDSVTITLIEEVLATTGADLVYTPHFDDTHQDHRSVSVATQSATRRLPRLLMYETPTSVRFNPTTFIDIESTIEPKLELLSQHSSQVARNELVDLDVVRSLARTRGFAARVRYAEGFIAARFLFDLGHPDPLAAF